VSSVTISGICASGSQSVCQLSLIDPLRIMRRMSLLLAHIGLGAAVAGIHGSRQSQCQTLPTFMLRSSRAGGTHVPALICPATIRASSIVIPPVCLNILAKRSPGGIPSASRSARTKGDLLMPVGYHTLGGCQLFQVLSSLFFWKEQGLTTSRDTTLVGWRYVSCSLVVVWGDARFGFYLRAGTQSRFLRASWVTV